MPNNMDVDNENARELRTADKPSTSPAMGAKAGEEHQAFSPELLSMYYTRLFPFKQMFEWLSYANQPASEAGGGAGGDLFLRREFSFTIEDDIYIRYLCFRDAKEFEQQVTKKQPHKIDIGAVYTLPPKDHVAVKPGGFYPVERELVFDVDLTDYDDVRTCCSGAKICRKCWSYMVMAVKVMDRGLREDFGFRNLLWIYSGRRGVHCWVADAAARGLTNDARSAVADYFSLVAGNENQARKVKVPWPIHPSLRRAYTILEPLFVEHVISEEGQGLLAEPEQWKKVLEMLPYQGMADDIYTRWQGSGSSEEEKWEELVQLMEKRAAKERGQKNKKLKAGDQVTPEQWRHEVVFAQAYPRLDVNVSKCRNHLLKSPFAAHPKTGRVCVPIDPDRVEDFDPFSVPTLGELAKQIDDYDHRFGQEAKGTPDVDKTDMKKYIGQMEDLFLKPLRRSLRSRMRHLNEERAAAEIDF